MYESNYDSALVYVYEGVEVVEENGLGDKVYNAYNALAKVYNYLERYDDAVIQYRKALTVMKHQEDRQLAAYGHSSLATGLIHANELDSALHHYDQALTLGAFLQDSSFNAYCYGNLAVIYERKEDWAKMHRYLVMSEKAQSSIGLKNIYPLANTYKNLITSSLKLERPAEALEYARKSISIAQEIEDLKTLKLGWEKKAEAHARLGQYDSAYFAYQAFSRWDDSLRHETQTTAASEMEAKYQLEQFRVEVATQELEIARQSRRQYQLLLLATVLLGLTGLGFWGYRNRQRRQKRETDHQLALQRQRAETLSEMDEIKSRFFANISHEFRTPLTLILGPLKQLLAKSEAGTDRTLYGLMQKNANRLLTLINQLLDLSRLEAGKLRLNPRQGNLFLFLTTLAAQFESWAESKQIDYTVNVPQENWPAAFDPEQLNRIISNLLSNAFKYTQEGGRVSLRARRIEDDLEVVVADSGIGLTKDERERIFDRYYQVAAGDAVGTGIGLSLVRELVDLLGGTITVASEPGQGSRFTLRWTVPRPHDQPAWLPASTPVDQKEIAPAESTSPVHIKGDHLLIVEDNADVRQYLGMLLRDEFHVTEAENGVEGLETARREMPDLILSDVMMPKMDGFAFTRAIKTDVRTSHIPVIQLTAKAGRENLLEGLQTQADDYLTKPFDEEELRTRIRNRIEQRRRLSRQLGKDIVRLSPQDVAVKSADKVFLERILEVAETYLHDDTFSIEDLGREVGLSRSQLHRKLRALTNQSPSVFLRTLRLKRAKELLRQRAGTAAEIAYETGFGSPSYFSKCFKDQFGITPGEV